MPRNVNKDAREGGREAAEPLTSGLSGAANAAATSVLRNSSGSASTAASLLDLRQKVNVLFEVVASICMALGDEENVALVKRIRQEGFRRGR